MALLVSSSQYSTVLKSVNFNIGSSSLWFNPNFASSDSTNRYLIFTEGVNYNLYVNANAGTLVVQNDGLITTFDYTHLQNTWQNLVFCYNKSGSIQIVYINGVALTQSGSSTGSWGSTALNNSDRLFIGNNNSTGNNFLGAVAEIATYNTVLTSAQVTELASGISPTATSGLSSIIGYWNFINPSQGTYPPQFGLHEATIFGSSATGVHPPIFYRSVSKSYTHSVPFAPATGQRIPEAQFTQQGLNDNLLGVTPWTNPNNVNAIDQQYASVTLPVGGSSQILRGYNCGFDLPPQAIIDGVQIEVWFNFTGTFTNIFQVYNGTDNPPSVPGFILRASPGDLSKYSPYLQNHPLIKHVIIEAQWSSIETSQGVYNTSALNAAVNQWSSYGYKIILNIYPYIQNPSTVQTSDGYFLANGFPTYLYNVLETLPNGLLKYTKSNGSKLAVPVVYSDPSVLQRYTALMQYLANTYDGDTRISFVLVAQGDIGHLAIGPAEAATPAVNIGFTNQLWANYGLQLAETVADVFPHTPLAAISEKGYFGNTTAISSDHGSPWLNAQLASGNPDAMGNPTGPYVSIIENKMETLNVTDPTFPNNTDGVAFFDNLDGVNPYAGEGKIREGYGADYPLWVPVCAQGNVGTTGHNYSFASTVLNSLLGYVSGHGQYSVTLIMMNPPDSMATNPNNPATTPPTDCSTGIVAFDPTIYGIYLNAYNQLLANAAISPNYGTPNGQIIVSGSGSANLVYGTNTDKWGLTLTPAIVNSPNFGFGFLVSDTANVGPTVNVDAMKMIVQWHGAPVAYTQPTSGGVLGNSYILDTDRFVAGGALASGSALVNDSEHQTPSGGALASGAAKPYTEVGSGGTLGSGSTNADITQNVSGGAIAGAVTVPTTSRNLAIIGIQPPASGGVLGSGAATVNPEVMSGGVLGSGTSETGVRTSTGGANAGGISAIYSVVYNPPVSSGTLASGSYFSDIADEVGSGGVLGSGAIKETPYFETMNGGVLTGGDVPVIAGDSTGGANVSGHDTDNVIDYDIGSGGAVDSGSVRDTAILFNKGSGGALAGGTVLIAITQGISGGTLGNGQTLVNLDANPSSHGGTIASGAIRSNYRYTGSGSVIVSGRSPLIVKVGLRYNITGNGEAGPNRPAPLAGIELFLHDPTVIVFHIKADGAFTGSQILVDSGINGNRTTYRYTIHGNQIIVGGHTPGRTIYKYNVVIGSGIEITGIGQAWFSLPLHEGRYNIALNLIGTNIIKTQFLTVQQQLAEQTSTNPALVGIDFSVTNFRANLVQGAYLPVATVNNQKGYLPKQPQDNSVNRIVQIARES